MQNFKVDEMFLILNENEYKITDCELNAGYISYSTTFNTKFINFPNPEYIYHIMFLYFKNINENKFHQIEETTDGKLEYYDDKELDEDRVIQIGEFVDLAGSYMMNIDANSTMVKNYVELLRLTNEAIELNNPFYNHHSKIVQIVSVEIAKSLFLSQE